MTHTTHGRIHGKIIELDEDLGVPRGQQVEIVVRLMPANGSWGDGIRSSAGAAAEVDDFDQVFAEIERERKAARFREADE